MEEKAKKKKIKKKNLMSTNTECPPLFKACMGQGEQALNYKCPASL